MCQSAAKAEYSPCIVPAESKHVLRRCQPERCGAGCGSRLAGASWLAAPVPPPSVHARYGHTLRFYIMPYFAKCPPVSRGAPLVAATAGAPCGFTKTALCKVPYAGQRARQPSALPGHCVPYAPSPVALWVCWHLGISQALRASFWLVACGQSLVLAPAHPWASPLRGIGSAAARPPPEGAPSVPRWGQGSWQGCALPCLLLKICTGFRRIGRYDKYLRYGRNLQTVPQTVPLEPPRRKDLEHFCSKSLIHMVGVKGFEPSTPCTPCKCATRLRHTPKQ